MKRLLFLLLMLVATIVSMASVRYPAITFSTTLKDGRAVKYRIVGNTNFSYLMTTDGEHIVEDGEVFRLATEAEHAKLLADIDSINNAIMALEAAEPVMTRATLAAMKEGLSEGNPKYLPRVGSPKIIVLLYDFADREMTFGPSDFDKLFNGNEYLALNANGKLPNYQNYGSVRQYFRDSSHGLFEPVFEVSPQVYHLPGKASDYIEDGHVTSHVNKLLDAADDDIDFSQYDLVCFLCAGYMRQFSGKGNDMNCYSERKIIPFSTRDGKDICRYIGCAELGLNSSVSKKYITSVGHICHELCHAMGLPDYYPTLDDISSADSNNQSMEFWDLMDAGFLLGYGYYPAPLTYFNRWLLGWVDEPLTVEADKSYVLNLSGNMADEAKAMRIVNPANPAEYWMLENIPQWSVTDNMGKEVPEELGWYYGVQGSGMLVTHVNYSRRYFELDHPDLGSAAPNNSLGWPRINVIPADDLLLSTYYTDLNLSLFKDIGDDARTDVYPQMGEGSERSRYTIRLDEKFRVLPKSDWKQTYIEAKEVEAMKLKPYTYSPDLLSIMNIEQTEKNGPVSFTYSKHPDTEKKLDVYSVDGVDYYTSFFSSKLGFLLPEGAVAYYAELNEESNSLTLKEYSNKAVFPGVAVIIKTNMPDADNTITLTQYLRINDSQIGNVLVGVDEVRSQHPDYDYYVLSATEEHGLGFYKLSRDQYLGANKAFMRVRVADNARATYFSIEGVSQETSIHTIGAPSSANAVYNFSGQRISTPQSGLNIVNGRKVVIIE